MFFGVHAGVTTTDAGGADPAPVVTSEAALSFEVVGADNRSIHKMRQTTHHDLARHIPRSPVHPRRDFLLLSRSLHAPVGRPEYITTRKSMRFEPSAPVSLRKGDEAAAVSHEAIHVAIHSSRGSRSERPRGQAFRRFRWACGRSVNFCALSCCPHVRDRSDSSAYAFLSISAMRKRNAMYSRLREETPHGTVLRWPGVDENDMQEHHGGRKQGRQQHLCRRRKARRTQQDGNLKLDAHIEPQRTRD